MQRSLLVIAGLAALSACDTPNSPSISTRDIDRAFSESARVKALPFTDQRDIPTGSATYEGQLGANVTGDETGSILGNLELNVGFDSNRISGTVSDINLIDKSNRPDQRLDGSLNISGSERNPGDIDAVASGELKGVDDLGTAFDTTVVLDLEGALRNDRGIGDAVYGDVDGTGRGDIDIEIDGVFSGRRR